MYSGQWGTCDKAEPKDLFWRLISKLSLSPSQIHLLSPYTDNDKTTLSVSSSDSRTSPLQHLRWSASLQHLKTLSDSPRVIHGMSVMHWRWASRHPMQLPVRATVSGYLSRHLICVRGWQYNVWHRGCPMRPYTVKQTEKHLCVLTVNLPHIDCCY